MVGRTIAHYQIQEKIGEGGMGVVYRARDLHLDRFVAIKVLPPERVADPDRKRRFVQEAKAASALNHPNIITIHDIAADAGADFIVMELVAGRALDAWIGRRGLKLADTLKYAVQIADALATAHEAGIIHRDLKPSNVMVTDKGQVKVLDFGLAKLTEVADPAENATQTLRPEPTPLTEQGAVLGTVSYMSPEQTEGKKVDPRSDIFSFGSLLYEMVTGHRAFAGDSKMSTITAILRDDPKPISQAGDPIPRDLEKIIARCLRKDPGRRFQHMADVKVALEELKEESDSGRLVVATPSAPRPRRTLIRVALVSLAALALLLAAALFWWRSGGSRTLAVRQLSQDSGLTGSPVLSPDGKFVAYESDRAGEGGPDIWIQQLSRGAQPIRLTRHKTGRFSPSFSPDGSQIVFTSGAEPGGVYLIPALGGEERLLLRGPFFHPRFSPDGQLVVCSEFGADTAQRGLLLIPVSGGAPRKLAGAFYFAATPVWSPDGKEILFWGRPKRQDPADWWIAPLDGRGAVKTGAAAVLPELPSPDPGYGFEQSRLPKPADWLNDHVLFSSRNLWRLPVSPRDHKVVKPEQLTAGAAVEVSPRAIAGPTGWRIVFASTQEQVGLWRLPIDLDAAQVLSEPAKLLGDAIGRTTPSLSASGSRLVYVSRELDGFGVRSRDLATGAETTLVRSQTDLRARISPDGAVVAYNLSGFGPDETVIYLVPSSGGDSRKFCDSCGLIYDWSPDGKSIVYRTGKSPIRFSIVEVATGRKTEILAHPKRDVHAAVYSTDRRWIAVHFSPTDGPRTLFLAPAGPDGTAAPPSEWIAAMDRPGLHTRPFWSPNGNVLYFLSTAGGDYHLWARRLDRATRRPLGEPFVVYHPSGERRIQGGLWFGPALGPNQIIFPVIESTGNIWLAE